MKRRILSIVLALSLAFALLPFGALAAEDLKPYAAVLEPLGPDVCGAYYDLDGDGTPELILLVPENDSCAAVVCTLSGGKAVQLLHESFSLGNEKLTLLHGERGELFLHKDQTCHMPFTASHAQGRRNVSHSGHSDLKGF